MRVLLAQPPLAPAGEVAPPLGLCTLASWLQSRGHHVRIVDLDLEVRCSERPRADYIGIFSQELRDFVPELVAVTSMYSNSLQAEQLVRAAKRIDTAAITVAGGSHFGALSAHALRRIPELDYAVEGEGEAALAALLDGVAPAHIPRLHYRVNGQLRSNPAQGLIDLATLPPMWCTLEDSVELQRYSRTRSPASQRRIVYIEAGRGCPFGCSFCATAPYWEHRFRVKPVKRLVEEIRFLHQEFGYDAFVLVHDLLTASRAFVSAFCDAMLESRLPVEWMANSRTDSRLDGLLPKMKAAGCWKLFHGVESAAPRVQKAIAKHLPIDGAYKCIDTLHAHGIAATTSFVIGVPTETASELSSTIAMGARLKLLGVETVQFHRLRHFPPSPLSRQPREAAFDLESLRIEYPFLEVPNEDIGAIRADPEFFSGYWATDTPAGSPAELAQVEMFFHHTVAMAPLTIAAVASIAGERLVPRFYEAASSVGAIRRDRLDWETGNLWENWRELSPLLHCLIDTVSSLRDWRWRLLSGLAAYEAQRIRFVTSGIVENAIGAGRSWAAFDSPVQLAAALKCLRSGAGVARELLQDTVVVLSRQDNNRFCAYLVESARRGDLLRGAPGLIELFV